MKPHHPCLWRLELALAATMTLPAFCLAFSAATTFLQQCAEKSQPGLALHFSQHRLFGMECLAAASITRVDLLCSLAYLLSIALPAWLSKTCCQRKERRSGCPNEAEEQSRSGGGEGGSRSGSLVIIIRLAGLLSWCALSSCSSFQRPSLFNLVPFVLLVSWILNFVGLKLFQGAFD